MAASKIGSVQFRTIGRFAPDPLGTTLEEISRPGADGHEYRDQGERSEPFTVTALVDVTSAANAAAMVETVKALQGTLVTVYDDRAQQYDDVCVERVRCQGIREVKTAVGYLNATPTHDVAFEVTLRMTT